MIYQFNQDNQMKTKQLIPWTDQKYTKDNQFRESKYQSIQLVIFLINLANSNPEATTKLERNQKQNAISVSLKLPAQARKPAP